MAARLRIRRVYLAALEEGRIRDLPSAAYAIGFVRNYSGALGLDQNDLVRRFRDAIQGTVARKTDLVFPEPVPERGFPAGVVVLIGVLLAIGAYAGWYYWSGSGQRSVDTVPAIPPRLEQVGRATESPPASPPVAPAAPLAPSQPVLAVPSPAVVPVIVPPPPPAAAAPAAAAPPPAADQARIMLRFRAESWTQLRDPRSGQILLNRVMRAGETFAIPNDRPGLVVSTGNAQGMEILIDGQVSGIMNGLTGVRRDIPLDIERLRQPAATPRPG
jgi:cytoskeleton protein RodZ